MLPIQVQAQLARSHGLIRFTDLGALGVDPSTVARLVTRRELVRIRRGVYTSGAVWESTPSGPARELLRARAVSLVLPHGHVLSHDSAAHALGLAFLGVGSPEVHITRPRVHGDRPLAGVKQHRGPYREADVVEAAGLRVLDRARTALDLTRFHGPRVGLGACDSARRAGISRDELVAAVADMRYWRGVKTLREVIAMSDPGADNPGESLARLLVLASGVGDPETQFPVAIGSRVAWSDLRVGRQLIEFDGRTKYRRVEDGGVATVDPGQVVWRERSREQALLRAGFGVSRLVWADLQPDRWAASIDRVRREVAETSRRLGEVLEPHHRQFAERCAAERQRRIFGHGPDVA